MSTVKLICRHCGDIFEGDNYLKVDQERNQHESSCTENEENK